MKRIRTLALAATLLAGCATAPKQSAPQYIHHVPVSCETKLYRAGQELLERMLYWKASVDDLLKIGQHTPKEFADISCKVTDAGLALHSTTRRPWLDRECRTPAYNALEKKTMELGNRYNSLIRKLCD